MLHHSQFWKEKILIKNNRQHPYLTDAGDDTRLIFHVIIGY